MKLLTSLIPVKKITCTQPRSAFSDDELEKAAQSILESEGVINPIVVRRTSLQSYELVDGVFEYYAAARAREINPLQGEMITVFIIEPENDEFLTKQVDLFRKLKSNSQVESSFTSKDLENFLHNLESRLEKRINELLENSTAKVKLENENREIKKQLANKIEPLDVFTKFSQEKITRKLLNAGFQKNANQIAEIIVKEREKEQFKSLHDVIERVKILRGKQMVKGISEARMLDIIGNLFSED
ncbi:ParB N-terminal domain-containing protein [Umezakia ovalisporum]|jgi:hypothetical protein|uniref:ParB N-terminal domain-containing protein n=2 Tax=Umezakia ovalisporum TaxID=75695 RepID=A0AA43GWL9_9CYAN|nr:ParB N-terminal domain-containing protein [Umezakia ovalisporum]MDH6056256.1 ParB N-terminal domain-containing protein [Umezakia ovalisporum FSS-43]MDH6062950.1 ParB N-terminal domain-containing protein [Umezakia ovalisporum FSS-62]MDH6067788.1 ParB N-terminal domain-containing protein [Umezakia ovalisporum APH033B]MDH6070904.1 ParB N-terminal domain-containing protein [Umezakia ovalisporum CobakiLakeA]MDH6074499.1 ParB N-terminal domain-containing protein [Umezakia ovalisporum CS-1034]